MSFSGKPTHVIQQAIPNDGFWPRPCKNVGIVLAVI